MDFSISAQNMRNLYWEAVFKKEILAQPNGDRVLRFISTTNKEIEHKARSGQCKVTVNVEWLNSNRLLLHRVVEKYKDEGFKVTLYDNNSGEASLLTIEW